MLGAHLLTIAGQLSSTRFLCWFLSGAQLEECNDPDNEEEPESQHFHQGRRVRSIYWISYTRLTL